jgi:hypothetical protein
MLYWECKRRLELLRRFRVLTSTYFENIQFPSWSREPILDDESQKARHEINLIMNDLELSFNLLGIEHHVLHQPPPHQGGLVQTVNLVLNMFVLWQFQLDPRYVFDCTDRAIGAYENKCRRLFRSSFNPFYWLGLLLVEFLRLPFRVLGAAGFNASKAEGSLWGKLAKVVFFLATVIPAVFAIIDHWSGVVGFLHTCVAKIMSWL